MITIRRTDDDEYHLETDNGVVINTYDVVGMTHPDDWIDDAVAHGVSRAEIALGEWQYVDDRPEQS